MSRNPVKIAVSLLVLLVALLGTAMGEPQRQEQRRRPTPQQAGTVRHDTKFHTVPGSKLEIRAVVYNGSVNGTLNVEVRNPDKVAQKFSAAGLYFVPEGNPDTAPQRLGAVGPLQQIATNAGKELTELEIAPGATVEVALDVFCIDSHRGSPSPQNVFNVGVTKMPKELSATIENRADNMVRAKRAEGAAAPRPAAKGDIQGEVWKSRDAKWIPLDGEGKQEVGKKK
jgi:hypothetical protein